MTSGSADTQPQDDTLTTADHFVSPPASSQDIMSSPPCMVQVLEQIGQKEVVDIQMLAEDHLTNKSEACTKTDPQQNSDDLDHENRDPEALEDKHSGHHDKEKETDVSEFEHQSHKKAKGYKCKCCPFWCKNLTDFKAHVDSSHPNVILNPQYHCAICDFHAKKFEILSEHNKSHHPDENNFKFKKIKKNNMTILEQTIQSQEHPEIHAGSDACLFPPCLSTTVKSPGSVEVLHGDGHVPDQKDQITALSFNGTVIIPEPCILRDLSHVTPVLQRPPNVNFLPKVAVPLNTTKYNPSLDHNLTLITSFNKFPYPTHAELSWLTAASKHPEEQIKVWFTTQRLKQGITWSPEEVEEARKKMFNGSIPPAHHTFTALPTGLASSQSTKASHQAAVHNTIEKHIRTATPNSDSGVLTKKVLSGDTLKRSLISHSGPESKRPVMVVAPSPGDRKDKVLMSPPPPPPFLKDSHLNAPLGGVPSVTTDRKKASTVVPLMPVSSSLCVRGKSLAMSGNTKNKPVVSLPSIVFPESLTRPMIAPLPIFAPPFKSSLLIPRSSKEKLSVLPAADVMFPNLPQLVTAQVKRPPIIQSVHTPSKALVHIPGVQEQQSAEVKGALLGGTTLIPVMDANGMSGDLADVPEDSELLAATKPDSQQKSSVLTHFPLLERMKGKTSEQLKILEDHFQRNSFLSHSDVENLAVATSLSHQEIDGWFAERQALRDNLELAFLNSMGTKRMEVDKHLMVPLNGIHKQSSGVEDLKMPTVLPPCSGLNPNSCSVAPNSRCGLLLKDLSQTEGMSLPEVPPRQAGVDLAHWFCDGHSSLHAELFLNTGLNGGQRPLPKTALSGSCESCKEVGVANSCSKMLEVELGWLMEQRNNNLSTQQHNELQGRLSGRSV
ncbi:zinc fingers and homeoboxes protein 2-like isoform X2 [Dunckerocampus dactyliophorus]|uniref:zinc fingers and homeoboxes protein 2-like isoform X2 n=1 Tax=Dunckerocampus dactyliophorus TaxID=161453 RepID=UPI00240719E5|nr:zinc fingers and homeoboxes protein 2-like isoform X2 [Dunckerocampus dactyliophorus]